MRKLLNALSAGAFALACALAIALPANHAEAAAANVSGSFNQQIKVVGFGDVTASSTFATTSYADLAGSSISFTPTVNDETTAGRNDTNNGFTTRPAGMIEVSWSLDVSKATATTGTCAVYVNGAIVASSARVAPSGTEMTIGGDFVFSNTTVGAQTLKLQCKSGDTNTFTVNNGHVVYKEILPY